MVGATSPIRSADKVRMLRIKAYCGCLPCLLMGIADVHCTVEHVTDRGRRLEEQHQATIGLCAWHHFGTGPVPLNWNPSLAHGRRPFELAFGDEVRVLLPVQDFMLSLFEAQPWEEYSVPRDVARETRKFWKATLDAQASTPTDQQPDSP